MYQLIALRKKKKMSQQELAEKLGVGRARLSQWENQENLYRYKKKSVYAAERDRSRCRSKKK